MKALHLLPPLLLAAACTAPRPPTPAAAPPPAAPARVPAGCEANISGAWSHADVPGWRYDAVDDGTTVRMAVTAPPGAGVGGTTLEFRRTADGFLGHAEAPVATPGGPPCRVKFDAEIAACERDALLVRAVASATVDARCRMPQPPPPAPRMEHRLKRLVVTPDAGPASR